MPVETRSKESKQVIKHIGCQRAREAAGISIARNLSRGSCAQSPTFPSDDPRPYLRCPDFTEAGQLGGPVDVVRSDVYQEKLILIPVDDFVGDGGKPFDFAAGQRAEKHAELNMLAMVLEELEQLGPPLVIRNVVGAEVNPSKVYPPVLRSRPAWLLGHLLNHLLGHSRWKVPGIEARQRG